MIKHVEFLKRAPGLSVGEFRREYEKYAVAVTELIGDHCLKYVRRYLEPTFDGSDVSAFPFDVVTELWFADRGAEERVNEIYATLVPWAAEIERRIFDHDRTLHAHVLEVSSS